MVLFSRAFVRKRVISMATTASVAATSFALAKDPVRTHHVRSAMPIQYVADWLDHRDEQPFLSKNDAAMKKMRADTMIKSNGDFDRDFVEMMVPYHHGAVDMAQAELEYGHNQQLHRLAREIVLAEPHAITVMRRAVGGKPPAVASPTQRGAAPALPGGAPSLSMARRDGTSHAAMNMQQGRT
jgi:hypothetical protein